MKYMSITIPDRCRPDQQAGHSLCLRVHQGGFVLASAVFLLVIMAALAAFIVQVSVSSNVASGLDVQGARAYQAARLGVEAGRYSVQRSGACPATTNLSDVAGLNGLRVTWTCAANGFVENNVAKTIWQITATACTTSGAQCPSSIAAELQGADYVERQLTVVTER